MPVWAIVGIPALIACCTVILAGFALRSGMREHALALLQLVHTEQLKALETRLAVMEAAHAECLAQLAQVQRDVGQLRDENIDLLRRVIRLTS